MLARSRPRRRCRLSGPAGLGLPRNQACTRKSTRKWPVGLVDQRARKAWLRPPCLQPGRRADPPALRPRRRWQRRWAGRRLPPPRPPPAVPTRRLPTLARRPLRRHWEHRLRPPCQRGRRRVPLLVPAAGGPRPWRWPAASAWRYPAAAAAGRREGQPAAPPRAHGAAVVAKRRRRQRGAAPAHGAGLARAAADARHGAAAAGPRTRTM